MARAVNTTTEILVKKQEISLVLIDFLVCLKYVDKSFLYTAFVEMLGKGDRFDAFS